MSAGKSEVVAWRNRIGVKWVYFDGPKDPREIHDNGRAYESLVPESLLLDARAELAAKDEAYRLQFEACASMHGKLERAEAQAVESSRQLDLYRKAVNEIDDRVEYSTFNRDTIYAILSTLTDGLAAIDAGGGRGE